MCYTEESELRVEIHCVFQWEEDHCFTLRSFSLASDYLSLLYVVIFKTVDLHICILHNNYVHIPPSGITLQVQQQYIQLVYD